MPKLLAQDTAAIPYPGLWFVGLLLIAAIVAAILGVFRARSAFGPERFAAPLPLWPLGLALGIGAFVWFGVQVLYGGARAALFAKSHAGQLMTSADFNPFDYAWLATVPGVLGIAALLVANAMIDRPKFALAGTTVFSQLGFTLRRMLNGVGQGALAFLAVCPLMFAAGIALDAIYEKVGFKHPEAHELLAAMKDSPDRLTRCLLIFGATVCAPFLEEYLFRGHLQTILARLFTARLKPAPSVDPVAALEQQFEPPPRSVWPAILCTSAAFALVHPMWMWPLIFLLALCLGYAYERTGNLWTSITIHFLFNTVNTIIFLREFVV